MKLINKFLEFFKFKKKCDYIKIIRNIKILISEQYPNYYNECVKKGKTLDNIITNLLNIYNSNSLKNMDKSKKFYKLKAKVLLFTGETYDELIELLGDNCKVDANNGELIITVDKEIKIAKMNMYVVLYTNGNIGVYKKEVFEASYECIIENEMPVKNEIKSVNPLLIAATAKPLS